MSGVGKRTRPPNIDKVLMNKLFNPSIDFPEDLKDKIFLCDRDAPKPDEYEEQLDRHPIEKPFPPFDPPYKDQSSYLKEYYHDKEDKKALNDKRVSEIARIEELRKRKKRMNELENIYKNAKEKFEELKSAQSTRTQKTSKDAIQKILDKSKYRLDSSDDDNSNDSSSIDNDESEDNDTDRYASSDDDEPREKRRTYQEKSKSSKTKSDKKDDNYDSPKKKPTRQIHEPDKEKNYQLVTSGKITSLPFVEEVYNQQKYLLDKLNQMNSNSKSEETLKKIQEQENKVNTVHKILKQLNVMPEAPSMAPDNNIKPEKIREYDIYQRKLDLAQKEIEKENSKNIHQDKFESASSTANAIDESFKDVFGSADDSNSSDSDDNILNEI